MPGGPLAAGFRAPSFLLSILFAFFPTAPPRGQGARRVTQATVLSPEDPCVPWCQLKTHQQVPAERLLTDVVRQHLLCHLLATKGQPNCPKPKLGSKKPFLALYLGVGAEPLPASALPHAASSPPLFLSRCLRTASRREGFHSWRVFVGFGRKIPIIGWAGEYQLLLPLVHAGEGRRFSLVPFTNGRSTQAKEGLVAF